MSRTGRPTVTFRYHRFAWENRDSRSTSGISGLAQKIMCGRSNVRRLYKYLEIVKIGYRPVYMKINTGLRTSSSNIISEGFVSPPLPRLLLLRQDTIIQNTSSNTLLRSQEITCVLTYHISPRLALPTHSLPPIHQNTYTPVAATIGRRIFCASECGGPAPCSVPASFSPAPLCWKISAV